MPHKALEARNTVHVVSPTLPQGQGECTLVLRFLQASHALVVREPRR